MMAEGSPDLAASIAELQALLLGTESIDGFLREMAVLAAGTLGEGLSCGITLQPNDRPLTVAARTNSPRKSVSCSTGWMRARAWPRPGASTPRLLARPRLPCRPPRLCWRQTPIRWE
jgi:hypothetical protein